MLTCVIWGTRCNYIEPNYISKIYIDMFLLVFTLKAIDDEKRTAPFSEVEVFQKGKLKHVETEEKNTLPTPQGEWESSYI